MMQGDWMMCGGGYNNRDCSRYISLLMCFAHRFLAIDILFFMALARMNVCFFFLWCASLSILIWRMFSELSLLDSMIVSSILGGSFYEEYIKIS